MAASSVARKVDLLEAELGVKLFVRGSRSIVLTDAGAQFLPRAQSIASEMDDGKHALADLHVHPRGRLSVTSSAAFWRRHVIPAVASFLKRYPLIEVDLHLSDERVDLMTQRVDLAIRIGILPDSDLIATQLAPVTRLACASQEYIATHGRPASPEELLNHNCLTLASTPVPPGWWCFSGVNREAALPVRGTPRTDDTEALLNAAVAGLGIVHLATWLVSSSLASGALVSLFPDLPAPSKGPQPAIHAVRMTGRSHATKAQLFIAHLKDCFGEPPYWDRTR